MERFRLVVLEYTGVNLDPDRIGKMLLVHKTGAWDRFMELLETARALIGPRAVYTVSYIDQRSEQGVVIDGIPFSSRVLGKNLSRVERVFPYVVTIGPELEAKISETEDLLDKYSLDTIGNVALSEARNRLEEELKARFALDSLSFMSPGSLKDWPMEEQAPLFSLLSGRGKALGVNLNSNLLMIPKKSVSGIYFPTETSFYNCQLCPRSSCQGRKAPYDKELAKEYGVFQGSAQVHDPYGASDGN